MGNIVFANSCDRDLKFSHSVATAAADAATPTSLPSCSWCVTAKRTIGSDQRQRERERRKNVNSCYKLEKSFSSSLPTYSYNEKWIWKLCTLCSLCLCLPSWHRYDRKMSIHRWKTPNVASLIKRHLVLEERFKWPRILGTSTLTKCSRWDSNPNAGVGLS